ncbi:hypothetical protein IMX26_15585 [Clostridium sp. 'deep sea']|uniref:hypothetical protein n=1 Tax=Clostridium sp. 'deep sea' TaxID=2779445 RepID=UPI00189651CC|nr:hypothetical protein [Clostridium sp. 'deep sea']QOR34863.1 hypothetical protein IMX26_15585 [Clostridium sp. 'deep sea']
MKHTNLTTKYVTISKAAVLLLSLILICAIGTNEVFAANSFEKDKNNIDENSNIIMSRLNKHGEEEVSLDYGETWINEAEYYKDNPLVELEYYSYEEYKAWLEQEKIDLQNIVGEKGWNPTDGWYTWTQEKINEAISMYEQTLEDIKNGKLVSKPLCVAGDNDCVIAMVGEYWPDKEHIKARSSFACILILNSGKTVEFGPYDTKEALGEEVKKYCEEQVANGSLTLEEANENLKEFGLVIEVNKAKTV